MVAGVTIGFIYGWQLALLVLALLPIIGLGGYLGSRMRHGNITADTTSLEQAGKVCTYSELSELRHVIA